MDRKGIKYLQDNALSKYMYLSGIRGEPTSQEFVDRLIQQGLLIRKDGTALLTGYAMLLFGKEPRVFLRQAGLMATVYGENSSILETNDFDEPLVLVPERFEQWLKLRLTNAIDRSSMQRRERIDDLLPLIREAVINAMVHRDYDITGALTYIDIYPGSINIRSPGGPLPPITLNQLQSFDAPALSRNPQLRYVFNRMKLAEERGFGMVTFKTLPKTLGLRSPQYRIQEPYLVLELSTNMQLSGVQKPEQTDIRQGLALNEEERLGWSYVNTKRIITKSEYASAMGFNDRKAERHLKRFVDLGLVRREGKGPSTNYQVND